MLIKLQTFYLHMYYIETSYRMNAYHLLIDYIQYSIFFLVLLLVLLGNRWQHCYFYNCIHLFS